MSLAVCDSCGGVLMTGGILSFSIVPPEQCMMPLHAELAEARRRTYQAEEKAKDAEEKTSELEAKLLFGAPHQNKKGKGAWYASKIKRLGPSRADCLVVLQEARAVDWRSGLTTIQVAAEVREMRTLERRPVPADLPHSLGGRLSELQGLGLVKSETNVVNMEDADEQKFRTESPERWFLTQAGEALEPKDDANPQFILQSFVQAGHP